MHTQDLLSTATPLKKMPRGGKRFGDISVIALMDGHYGLPFHHWETYNPLKPFKIRKSFESHVSETARSLINRLSFAGRSLSKIIFPEKRKKVEMPTGIQAKRRMTANLAFPLN